MAQKINRQDLIVTKASELFMAQGYNATSVRQIAESAGCTDAALYYHFRDGKRALLQAVIAHNLPDFLKLLVPCQNASSLYDLITAIGSSIEQTRPLWARIGWLVAEYPHLSAEEQGLVHQAYLTFQTELVRITRPFVTDDARAEELSWLVICALFGYVQTFLHLGMQDIVSLPYETFKTTLARLCASV
jgi:AcrR family transcriptional regulator